MSDPILNDDASPQLRSDAARAMLAGFLGWTLDAFDFFLVVISVPQLMNDFGKTKMEVTFSLTLTLMFRPIGALIFGLLADRFGRRGPMMINLVFYSLIEVLTGLTHSWTVFLILRALFGIGMGGEWGVGASLVMEKVSPRWRGVLSGLLQEGYAFGYLLSALVAHFALDRVGWRPLFIIGGLPALLAIFIRMGVRESEVWQKTKSESWSQLGDGIAANWKIFLYLVGLMAMMNLSSHGTQDIYPTFLKEHLGFTAGGYTNLVIVSMVGAIVGGLVFGLASDRFGRRICMTIAFVGAILAVPIWAMSQSHLMLGIGAFCMQFMVQGAWGIIPAHINELSPDKVRGFLPGFAYQCGNLIAAGVTVGQAHLAESHNFATTLAVSAAAIFIVAIIVTVLGPEKKGVRFGEA